MVAAETLITSASESSIDLNHVSMSHRYRADSAIAQVDERVSIISERIIENPSLMSR